MQYLLLLLILLPLTAFGQADVPAFVTDGHFACRAKQATPGETLLVGQSIQLFRVDEGPGLSICADTVGETPVIIGFTVPFIAGQEHPTFKARAFVGAGCAGAQSINTINSCVVTYEVAAPVLLSFDDPEPEPEPPPGGPTPVALLTFDGLGVSLPPTFPVTDTSGNGNHGTVTGARPSALGASGTALAFDGIDDQVQLANSDSLNITGSTMTLAAWIFPRVPGIGAGSRVISKRTDAGGSDVYAMYTDPERRITFRLDITNARTTHQLVLGRWTHIAVVYDGVRMVSYIDGVLDLNAVARSGPIASSTMAVHIGVREGEGRQFNGLIDEVGIWNVALTVEQVQDLL